MSLLRGGEGPPPWGLEVSRVDPTLAENGIHSPRSEVGTVLPSGSSDPANPKCRPKVIPPCATGHLVPWPNKDGWTPAGPRKDSPEGGSDRVQAPISVLICSVAQDKSLSSSKSQLLPLLSGHDVGY